jgi:biopolymer transport protein TolR
MRTHRGRQRKIISEINVVPYIDVMLVLLIIFMITAPLITQGVKISLPLAPSEIISPGQHEPIVVSVDFEGNIFVDIGEHPEQPITDQVLSVGRALRLHRRCQEFESLITHHKLSID